MTIVVPLKGHIVEENFERNKDIKLISFHGLFLQFFIFIEKTFANFKPNGTSIV